MRRLKKSVLFITLLLLFVAPLMQVVHESNSCTCDINCSVYVLDELLIAADIDKVFIFLLLFSLYLYSDILTCKQMRRHYNFFSVRAPPLSVSNTIAIYPRVIKGYPYSSYPNTQNLYIQKITQYED